MKEHVFIAGHRVGPDDQEGWRFLGVFWKKCNAVIAASKVGEDGYVTMVEFGSFKYANPSKELPDVCWYPMIEDEPQCVKEYE